MDSLTAKKIKNKGSKIERIIGKALWYKGLRYRKNDNSVTGKPDFSFKSKKVAVFCDSEFWHGYNYLYKNERFKTNKDFWEKKIKRNIDRDKEVTKSLESTGWTVFRFWGKEITTMTDSCIEKVYLAVKGNKNG